MSDPSGPTVAAVLVDLVRRPGRHLLAFARAVREVTGDPEWRRKMLLQAVARAGEFAWPRTAARLFRLYDELVRTVRQAPDLHPTAALRVHGRVAL